MQHMQDNYKVWLCGLVLVVASFAAVEPAVSAGIVQPSAPDPILNGGPAGPCDPQRAGADYVGGTDVNGNPVASADLEGQPVPVPGRIDIPLKGGAYVTANGKSLEPLLNPPPGCPTHH
jgi:hypothetical protein